MKFYVPSDASQEKVDLTDIPLQNYRYTMVELRDKYRDILQAHLPRTAYDRSGFFHDAIEEGSDSHKFDSFAMMQKYDSSNCIGLTLSLILDIYFKTNGNCAPLYVIPGTLPRHYELDENLYGHVALLSVCSDGIILMDSGFHISEPILLRKGETVNHQAVTGITWQFKWDGENINAFQGKESFKYHLKHISNPDDMITQTQTGNANKVSFVSRSSEGKVVSHVSINKAKQTIEGTVNGKRLPVTPINAIKDNVNLLDEKLSTVCSSNVTERLKYILVKEHDCQAIALESSSSQSIEAPKYCMEQEANQKTYTADTILGVD
ncbi:hypothetical protein L3V83_14250 [Thiotrichales bacterium 19X7-9]|nr:hypothetical protein [Thiotrichales bacterium 19X7-9]